MANVDVEDGVGGETRPTNKTNKWWPWNTKQEPINKTDVEILLECKDMGEDFSRKLSPSIYLIRSSDEKVKTKFFKPQVVSIGPLHRGEETLKPFEDQKMTHLHHLLGKLNEKPEIILDKCLEKVNASIDNIKECYGETTITYTNPDLAKMMVMDACFILDFLFLSKKLRRLKSRNAILTHSIFRDLVLIENQIPFFVLQNIFDCTISTIRTISLTSGVLEHLQFLIPFKGIRYNDVCCTTHPHHILGLLQKCFYPPNYIEPTCPPLKVPNHSALDLDKAGVKFKPNSIDGSQWPLNIDFNSSSNAFLSWCQGNNTLTIPELHIDDYTELFLRNVIAYEQCTPKVPDYITSYVCAIDMLIDTKEDLSKLVKSKVVTNHLGSNKDATKMLNRISKQFVFEEFYYTKQWVQLNDYYKGYVPKNMALLKSTYFSSPWTIIALFAGVVVFTFTILQAILRIIKY